MHILFAQGGGAPPDAGTIQAIIAAVMAAMMIISIVSTIIGAIMIVSFWILFTKAGEPGWASLIPIYNIIVLLKISGKPAWWILLFMCPGVNLIIAIIVWISLAQNFGKGTGFGIGLAFLPYIFFPILAFSDAEYSPVDEDGGRPSKRRRGRDDDDDDDDDDRPRGRRRPVDDDDDDRPAPKRRRPTDDDD